MTPEHDILPGAPIPDARYHLEARFDDGDWRSAAPAFATAGEAMDFLHLVVLPRRPEAVRLTRNGTVRLEVRLEGRSFEQALADQVLDKHAEVFAALAAYDRNPGRP